MQLNEWIHHGLIFMLNKAKRYVYDASIRTNPALSCAGRN